MSETEVLEPTSGVEETPATTEAPAALESAAPSAPVVETVTTEPAAGSPTRSRGPDGRFIKADGTQASEAEHAAIEAAASTSSPPAATTPQPPAPSAPPGEPFVFRADGQKIPIPGSSVSPEGHLTIPAEQIPAIRQLLAEGVSHRGSWRQREQDWQRQVEEAKAQSAVGKEKYNAAAVHMLDTIENEEWQAEFAANPQRALHYLKRDIALLLKEADLKAPKPAVQPKEQTQDPKAQEAQLETAARQTLEGYLEELLDTPQAKAVYNTPDKRQAVIKRYQRRLNAYFQEHEGAIALHENSVDADFQEELQVQIDAQRASVKATEAAAFNARRNAPAVTAPPVVSTKGPSVTGPTGAKKYDDRESWRKSMGIN